MQVILKQEISRLGFPGDVVEVKNGYARNYLLPRGFAEIATKGAMAARRRVLAVEERREESERAKWEAVAAGLNGKAVVIHKRAGTGQKLYGSVTAADIEAAVSEQLGMEVERRRLVLTEAIKTVGAHERAFRIASGIEATLTINVRREGEEEPVEEPASEGEPAEQ